LNAIDELKLEDILPHRGGMLLVDDILSVEENFAVTEALISRSFPMADSRGVPPLVMIELAAQTAGVCNGLTRIKADGKDSSKKGWLVGVKRAQFFVEDYIAFDSRLIIRSENRHEFDILREVFCVVHLGDALLAEITLQLIQA
jgi:predicted hotdog family 3-hydroxylacyl-ACP dehydratase